MVFYFLFPCIFKESLCFLNIFARKTQLFSGCRVRVLRLLGFRLVGFQASRLVGFPAFVGHVGVYELGAPNINPK